MKATSRSIGLILTIFLFIYSQSAIAAPQDDFFQMREREIREKREQEEIQRRNQEEMVRLEKEKGTLKKVQLPEEEVSFFIKEINIRGLHAEKFPWAQKYLNSYTNRKIGLEGINLLIKKVNEAFIDKGFVTTKLYITQQDINSGILTLDLAAGIVHQISFAQEDTWGTWRNAFPILPGDILNIRDIEQGLEQMRRLSSQDVDIDIQPAEQAGQSNLIISVKRSKQWRLSTTFDDSGSKGTGKNQLSTALQLENMLAINDIFYVSFNKDVFNGNYEKGTKANSIYFSIPWGKQTLSFSKSYNKYHQTAYTAVVPIRYSGDTDNFSFTLTHLLARDQTKKTNLELAIATKKSRSYLNDTEIIVQRQDTTNIKLGVTHRQYMGKAVFDAALRFQKGIDWLGAQPRPTDHLPDSPTSLYNMWLLDININSPIQLGNLKGRHNISVRAQKANNKLYGSDFFSIGGRYSVRGFDGEQTLSAEHGLTIRNEFSLEYTKNQQIYLNIDYGKVYGYSTRFLLGTELSGAAIGLRGSLVKGSINYDVFVGWPITKPDGFRTSKQTYGFQITMQF